MFSHLPAQVGPFSNCRSRVFCDTSHVSCFFFNLHQPHLSPPQHLPPLPHHHITAHNTCRPPTTTTTTAHPNMSATTVDNDTATQQANASYQPKRAQNVNVTRQQSTRTKMSWGGWGDATTVDNDAATPRHNLNEPGQHHHHHPHPTTVPHPQRTTAHGRHPPLENEKPPR
jgi:hypothetical protein